MELCSLKFSDLSASHSLDKEPNPNRFSMHTHTFSELYCFLSGRGIFHIEGSEYHLRPGDLVIMRPSEAHYIDVDPSEPYERISIHFDSNIFSSLDPDSTLMRPFFDRKAGKRNQYNACIFETEQYMEYFRNMFRSSTANRLNTLANMILILQELGILFDQNLTDAMEADTVEYRIIRYINQNLHRELALQELCDHYYISKAQLCRRFKKATGTTIAKYITIKRLVTSRQLLVQGQRPTDIYTMCGFRDYSTFYRAYTKYFGHSPKQESDRIYSEISEYAPNAVL